MVLTQGNQKGGMAVLRGQTGFFTWEIDRLLVESSSHDACAELLARTDSLVIRRHGMRMFLRLAEDSPVFSAATEAGYKKYVTEELYSLRRNSQNASRTLVPAPGIEMRQRRPEDDYPLFRLYTASTPVATRAAEGLTFREWQEATAVRWQGMSRVRDMVVTHDGEPKGWLRTAKGSSGHVLASAIIRPDDLNAAEVVQHTILETARDVGELRILLPTYATMLTDRLKPVGLRHLETYTSLVHQVGERVMEGAFVPAGL